MRVLIDITHPADVHLFKNVVRMLRDGGHQVLITAREKDVTVALLNALDMDHICISVIQRGILGKGAELIGRDLKLLGIARRFRPDVMVARIGVSIGVVGAILRIPRVVFEDTEHARLQLAISTPFASYICTGTGYRKDFGSRQIRLRGFPVMSYLAPKWFQPNADLLCRYGVDPARPYIVLRRVSWSAAHDTHLARAGNEDVLRTVARLSRFGRVLISSEGPLLPELASYESPVPVEHMHHLLSFAALYIGEGGTMAAEAAVLGTPSIFCSRLRCGYLLALDEQYGLLRNTDHLSEGLQIAEQWLARADLQEAWQAKREKMLEDTEDVTEFLFRLIQRIATNSAGRTVGHRADSLRDVQRRDRIVGVKRRPRVADRIGDPGRAHDSARDMAAKPPQRL